MKACQACKAQNNCKAPRVANLQTPDKSVFFRLKHGCRGLLWQTQLFERCCVDPYQEHGPPKQLSKLCRATKAATGRATRIAEALLCGIFLAFNKPTKPTKPTAKCKAPLDWCKASDIGKGLRNAP